MSLKNLKELGLDSQLSFKKYNKEEVILTEQFKVLYSKLFHSEDGEKITFSEFTTLVQTSTDLTITFPNQWFYIASYFVEYLNALKEYKEIYSLVFKNKSNAKDLVKNIKESGEIPDSIIQIIEATLKEPIDVEYFKFFLTDYDWWFGSKTIDRGDYFVSPILNLAKVVNVTQTYIAELANRLSTDPQLLVELKKSYLKERNEPIIPTTENVIFSNHSIRHFALQVFNHFYGKDWSSLIELTTSKKAKINDTMYDSLNFERFNQLIGRFNEIQTKDALTSSITKRYFEKPILKKDGQFYYFSTQWNGKGDYNLTFNNLKNHFESNFPNYQLKHETKTDTYLLIDRGTTTNELFDISSFISNIKNSHLIFPRKTLVRLVSSLITKPFVILSGLSGSGKTKLAQAFTKWICQDKSQVCIVPVGADWTNREPLLGYPNALQPNSYIKPENGVLDLILQANERSDLPHFLILDEMNLSHVERYFADFLSVMESQEEIMLTSSDNILENVPSSVSLPNNLFIVGTVNIDETTYMFSPKVLDRANTIEFRVSKKNMIEFFKEDKEANMSLLNTKGASMAKSFLKLAREERFTDQDMSLLNSTLVIFFEQLKKAGAEFGYRSASEITRLYKQLGVIDPSLSENEKIDIAIMQKLLPKLHGSRNKLCPVLLILGEFCITPEIKSIKEEVFKTEEFDFSSSEKIKYPLSLEKITRMYKGAIDNGFASYAEA